MGGQEDLTASLKAIMARKREETGGPPAPEELLAYRDGRLDPAARQRLEARLAVDPGAARTLADLAAFPNVEPAPGTPELSDEAIDARWQSFRDKLAALPARATAPMASAVPARRRSFARRLAAVLAGVGVAGAAGFWMGRASREIPGAAINVAITELRPVDESTVRSTPNDVEMPGDAEELVLVLPMPAEADFAAWEAEIMDAGGERLWSRQGLRPTELGSFHLSFRRGVLPAGRLRVRLFGRDGQERNMIAEYEVRVVPKE